MTDTADDKIPLPRFSGRDDDYVEWKMQFAAYMRQKGVNINERGQDGTLRDGRSALDATKKAKLADRLTMALGKNAIIYRSHVDDGGAMLQAIEARYQQNSALAQTRIERKLLATRLADPSECDAFIATLQTMFLQLEYAGMKTTDQQKIAYLIGALPVEYAPIITIIELDATGGFDAAVNKVMRHSMILRQQQSTEPVASVSNDALAANWTARSGGGRGRRRETRTCFTCGERGHIARDCHSAPCGDERNGRRASFTDTRDERRTGGRSRLRQGRGDAHMLNLVIDEDASGTHQAQIVTHSTTEQQGVDNEWVIDSGCTMHMTPLRTIIADYVPTSSVVHLADGSDIEAAGRGTVSIACEDDEGKRVCATINVLHVPALTMSLFSVSALTRAGGALVLGECPRLILEDCTVPLKNRGRLTVLQCRNEALVATDLLHRRLGHAGLHACRLIPGVDTDSDGESDKYREEDKCEPCMRGKMTRPPFPSRATRRFESMGELIHADHAGPLPESVDGHTYVFALIDDATRYTWVYTCVSRSDAGQALAHLDQFTEFTIKAIRTDNAQELRHGAFARYCEEHNIAREYTCPRTPQQNGVVERKLAHLFATTRAMLIDSKMPVSYWSFCMRHAAYVINRTPTSALETGMTPYQKAYGTPPDHSSLRVWGCAVWVCDRTAQRGGKFADRGEQGVFLGVSSGVKGYVVLLTQKNRITTSRDVVFEEHRPGGLVLNDKGDADADTVDDIREDDSRRARDDSETISTEPHGAPLENEAPESNEDGHPKEETPLSTGRVSRPPTSWWCAMAADEPSTFEEAQMDPCWRAAIDEELQNHEINGTWEVVVPPAGANLVDTKWIFKLKADGRHKARLVARGFSQQRGVDWHESYAPVTSTLVLRLFCAIACHEQWLLHHLDVKAAYLNADVEEEIYLAPPKGVDAPAGHACRVIKSLYGLRQSGRNWYQCISAVLTENDYVSLEVDPCVLVRRSNGDGNYCALALYVDDIAILASSDDVLKSVVELLAAHFDVTTEPLRRYLGIEVNMSEGAVTMHQREFTTELLESMKMMDVRTVTTPSTQRLTNDADSPLCDAPRYRAVVGKLLWLCITTRPDLAFALHQLTRYCHAPRQCHWTAVKRVLRYLRGTIDHCMSYVRGTSDQMELVGWSDSDWAGDTDTRRSTSGYLFGFILENNRVFPLSWRCGLQTCVALSSAESEYVALCDATKEVIYLRQLMSGLQREQEQPVLVWSDSRSAIAMTAEGGTSRRARHIEVRFHYTRAAVADGRMRLDWLTSAQMVADVLTKPTTRDVFARHVRRFIAPRE